MQDGSVGKAICRYIEKISSKTECQKVQLVMGARNLGFCARGLLGSVSDYCVRNASCPVTIFKG
jgi:nucleotide-binding universal stress UspA family protein